MTKSPPPVDPERPTLSTPYGSGPTTVRQRRHLQPPRLAKVGVTAAAWQLPPQYRSRYRLEFYAELHELSRSKQVGYAWALFLHSWSLALALREPERVAGVARVRKDIRCVLGMHHFVMRHAHDADATGSHGYLECTRCGRFRDIRRSPWSGAGVDGF